MGFLKKHSVGFGTTTTTGRNAGVGTASGEAVVNVTTNSLEVYNNDEWLTASQFSSWSVASPVTPSGPGQAGAVEYNTGATTFVVFYDPGTVTITGGLTAEGALLVGGGGAGGAPGGGGGGAGGLLEDDQPFPLASGTYTVTIGDGAPPVRTNSPANPEGPAGGNVPYLNPTGPIWPGGDTLGVCGQPSVFGSHTAYGGENGGGSSQLPAYTNVSAYPNPASDCSFAGGGAPYVTWTPTGSVGSGGALAYSGPSSRTPVATTQQPSSPFTGYGNIAGNPDPNNGGSGGAGGAGQPAPGGGGGGAERSVPTTLLPDPFTSDPNHFPSVFLNVPISSPSAQRRGFCGGAAAFENRAGSPLGTGGSGGPGGTQAEHSGTNFRGGAGGAMNTPNPGSTYAYGGKGVFIIKLPTNAKAS